MDEPRRNDAFDRELRRTLAAGGGAAGPHLDAELAAAWMDQRLGDSAARSIEAHLADCADCQMMMATLARISPETSVASRGATWWRRLRAGWLLPATAAAAAALVIWVALPQQRAASTPPERVQSLDDRAPAPDQLAKSQPAASESSETARSVTTPPVAPSPAAPEADAAATSARRFAVPPSEPQRKTADLARVAPPPAAPAPAASAPELERRDRAEAAAPAAVEPLKETITVQGQTPLEDAQTTRVGEAQSGRASARQEAAAPSQDQLRQNAASAAGAAGLRAAASLTIVATDGGARWRRAGSAIEFAPRAGAGFTAIALPVPAEAIAAGSSPGSTVCWLVGDGGLVLVSVDGVRFARVSAPAAVTLVAVTATDIRTAIVTASTGRRYRTADQGATWTALQ